MIRWSLLVLCLFTFGACSPENQGVRDANNSGTGTGTAGAVADDPNDTKSAFDQNENENDVQTTADIRKRIVDTEMSVGAQNVQIVTQNGQVTLEGEVANAEEKAQIEKIAKDVAGEDKVDSKLVVDQDQ